MIRKKLKYDSQQIGITSGLLIPVFVIFGFYLYRNSGSLSAFFNQIIGVGIFSELVSLCVVPNLLLFFAFMWTNRLNSARGVIAATFIYVIVVLILKSSF